MSPIFVALGAFFLIAALICWLLARRAAQQSGLPFGARIVYADTGAWEKVEKPLFSERYRLTGKPDYLVEENAAIIPVEVKPNRTASAPRESDVMQLAAYALLVAETFAGKPAPYGLLKYRDVVFRIEMTEALRDGLLTLVAEMRVDRAAREVSRSHREPHRCRACGYRAECGQALEV